MIAISSTSLTRASRNRQPLSKPRGKKVGKREVQEKERRERLCEQTAGDSSEEGVPVSFELLAEGEGGCAALEGRSRS